ncbi:MAG: protein phosphatase CheZ [Deltaproteobacteria bacterium]|nr:protein phosphatase CheZ [Deltaproteobacteria bacterium]
MSENKSGLSVIKEILNSYDTNDQAEIAAQLFLEYCIYQDQCTNTRRLAPLINTVAEALTKGMRNEDGLRQSVKAVQIYLQIPPVEYYGEALVRLSYLDRESVDEMLAIKPEGKVLGTFLLEQGLITQEQRDIAVIAQRRLFTIQEIHARVMNPENKGEETQIIEGLKDVLQHFLTSTTELENDLNHSNIESIPTALKRLENIISETETQTNAVLEIVENFFDIEKEMRAKILQIKANSDSSNNLVIEHIENLMDKLDFINRQSLNLNSTQQIQDRIGQQLLKIIPTIETFQNQITKIAQKLKLNWHNIDKDKNNQLMTGYERSGTKGLARQDDVDDLLSSLGL